MIKVNSIKILMVVLIAVNQLILPQLKLWGHRGASSVAPENTLTAFSKAFSVGSHGIELDVHLSSDDSIFVIHDFTVNRTTNGTGTVNTLTYDSLKKLDAGSWFGPQFLGERLPTLSEVVALYGDKPLIIELKGYSPHLPHLVIRCLFQNSVSNERVIIASFLKQHLDKINLISNFKTLYFVTSLSPHEIYIASTKKYSFIGANSGITPELVQAAKLRQLEIVPYTINNLSIILFFRDISIQEIITDYPQFNSTVNGIHIDNDYGLKFVSSRFDSANMQICVNFSQVGPFTLNVYNILGQNIIEENGTAYPGKMFFNYTTEDLPSGIYITVVQFSNMRQFSKAMFIK